MAADPISTATRSRSPHADRQATSSRPSPFCRPPGWQPPLPQVHRPVILQIDLKPMRQLAIRDSYYNILAPQVTGNLSTSEYDGPFQIYKVTRSSTRTTPPDTILENLKHWSWIPSLNAGPFTSIPLISSLAIETTQGHQFLNQPNHSILGVLNWHFPYWKTHQHCCAHPARGSEAPHPDASDTGVGIRIQSIPRGHPFFSHNAVMMTDPQE